MNGVKLLRQNLHGCAVMLHPCFLGIWRYYSSSKFIVLLLVSLSVCVFSPRREWLWAQQRISEHPDAERYFVRSPDDLPWTENLDLLEAAESRLPFDALDCAEAEAVWRNHVNALHAQLEMRECVRVVFSVVCLFGVGSCFLGVFVWLHAQLEMRECVRVLLKCGVFVWCGDFFFGSIRLVKCVCWRPVLLDHIRSSTLAGRIRFYLTYKVHDSVSSKIDSSIFDNVRYTTLDGTCQIHDSFS